MASSISNLLSSSGTSASTSSTGLGQGIDVNTFVQLALAGQQNQINSLQAQQTGINTQSSTLATITADLNALKASAAELNDPLGVLSDTLATSSNSTLLTATASSTATPGTHTIAVTSLATTSSYYSDSVGTGSTALATGDTIAISAAGSQVASVTVGPTNNTLANIAAVINSQATTYQSAAVATSSTPLATGDTIAITAGGISVASVAVNSSNNTLDQIAAAINGQTSAVHASVITDATGSRLSIANTASGAPANVGVTGTLHQVDTTAINFTQVVALQASVINDANGARLAIVSTASGAPGDLAVTGSLHRADNTAVGFNRAAQGLNAVLSVDGVPISSTSNSVSNVINGVTLNLTGPTGNASVTLTVAPDTSTIAAAINQFVSSYNTAITAINGQFQVAADGSGGGALEADNSLRDAQQQLLSAITYSTTGTGGAVNLTNLGISTNNDGTLSLDSGALASALSSNFSGVQSFLQTASTGFAGNLNTVLKNLTDSLSGVLGLDASGLAQSSQALSQQVSDLQAALAVQATNLNAIYAQVNITLQELPLLQNQLSQQLASIPR